MRALHASAVPLLPLGALFLLGACEPEKKVLPPVTASAAAYVSTGWEACDEESGPNPSPQSVDSTGFQRLLHGTWTVHRTVRDGKSMYPHLVAGNEPNAHYVLIVDTKSGTGLQYEERGPDITANGFATLLPAPTGAPHMTYLYCGGQQFNAFRDRYTKVSNDPADGLRALAQVTGQPVGQGSVSDAWARLRDSGFLTSDRGTAVITAAYYTVTTGQVQRVGVPVSEARWDMVGEYRGSPAKFTNGQPSSGLESGIFQGSLTPAGRFLVARDVDVACYGLYAADPRDPDAHVQPSSGQTYKQQPITYTKIVIGGFD